MRLLRSRRGLAAIAAILLILFLFRPGVHQLRNRIAGSIGSALGRKVAIENVRVRLLPRPGFDLEGLVIYDDPSFSAEPMVRAPDVSAAIRFRSLLRGRLEIATLSASEPSINLVRNDQGRWNLASLLERSARIHSLPTGRPASKQRPAFPYLEASHARINFKIGQAKKSWALTDADVALWQDSEDSWGARMTAQPVRTDFNLTDTGLVRVNAAWRRAPNLGETPVQVAVQWEKGQLGQITKLFSGRDRGWRGGVILGANLSGTPRSLQIRSEVRIEDFHRYDIMGRGNVRLSTTCSGRYSAVDGTLADLSCESPVGAGSVRLRGNLGPITTTPSYDLTLEADKVPLASALRLLRQAKKELPADLVGSGRLDAEFHALCANSGLVQLAGEGTAADVRLSSNAGKDEITFGKIPLALESADVKHTRPGQAGPNEKPAGPAEAYLRIGPFPLAMGASAPATAGGWVSASGYRFSMRGETELKNLYRLANTLGIPGFRPVADGSARVDVGVSGPWQGFAAPATLGTAQLHNVRTGMRGLNPPIEIASAIVNLEPDTVSLDKISAQTGDTHWSGFVKAPRHCAPAGCIIQFDLGADQLSSSGLAEWFTPRPTKRPWYRILTSSEQQGKSPLLAIPARGTLQINRLSLKKVDASQIVAQVDLDRGKITLTDLRAQVFQGTHQGNWVIDVSAMPPRYQAAGTLQNVSLAEVSTAMNDAWTTGIADGKFALTSAGSSFHDLLTHAEGELKVTMRNGTFAHIELAGAAKPFPVHLLAVHLKVKNGLWNLSAGKLESHDGIYQVSGTASPGSGLNLVLTRGDEQSWNVTGTLLKPRLANASRTEARTVIKP
ncbi:MAG: AsmA family protein [Terriglobales bacterium]